MFKSTKGLIFGRAKIFGEETDGSTDQALPPITLDAGAVQRLQHAKELLTPLDSLGIDTYPIENAKTVFGQYDPDLRKHLTRLHLPELSDRLVWIPPHLFKDIQQVAVGGFATVYTAGVEIPPQTYRFWDELLLGDRILLKEVDQTLLQELVFSIELSLHVVTARVFGLSQNTRTGQYLMCMEYARGGNLEQYPQHSDWHTVFEIANELAEKLYQMHKTFMRGTSFSSVIQRASRQT
ncbi:hypothetical protein BC938DRAFT_479882 [Jimgerdemannia flammicorona]|uniref:Protein kinase domain-containing protein n=1 Tax=Jimgerdemannia flammicorona TaxID=994334 RepID=A0A433QJW1_9FUNG|nr:hypothetical protein BC938DRAFT_479882 [Jimgerdemannia flammicorona]